MQQISLLDCTLRDGGFVNDWQFGGEAIRGIYSHLVNARIDVIEVGFGGRTLKIRVLEVKEIVGKADATALYEVVEE